MTYENRLKHLEEAHKALNKQIDNLEKKYNNLEKSYSQKSDELEKKVQNKELTREQYNDLIKKEKEAFTKVDLAHFVLRLKKETNLNV